jgi:hypothetical protein
MKKILVVMILTLAYFAGFSQYPIPQNLASDSTLVLIGKTSNGGIKGRFINFISSDTTAANLQRFKYYDGAQLVTYTGGVKFWLRYQNAWYNNTGGGGGGSTTVSATAPMIITGTPSVNPNVVADTSTAITGLATKGRVGKMITDSLDANEVAIINADIVLGDTLIVQLDDSTIGVKSLPVGYGTLHTVTDSTVKILIDTTVIASKLKVYNDSLAFLSAIALKTNNSDTAAALLNYWRNGGNSPSTTNGIIGTLNYKNLNFHTNGVERGRFDTLGRFRVGSESLSDVTYQMSVKNYSDVYMNFLGASSRSYIESRSADRTTEKPLWITGSEVDLANGKIHVATTGRVGVNTIIPSSDVRTEIAEDIDLDANAYAGQLRLSGKVNASYMLTMGYDTVKRTGFIQSANKNVSFDDLVLNKQGGNVAIGKFYPTFGFDINRKVGLNKDSIPISSTNLSALSLDTTTGQIVRTVGLSYTPTFDFDNTYNVSFPKHSFDSSILLNQLNSVTVGINNGLILNGSYSGEIESSRIVLSQYNNVINENYTEKMVFKVLDTTVELSIGIGIKGNQAGGTTSNINMSCYITATIGDTSGSTIVNRGLVNRNTYHGILINKGDWIQLSVTRGNDSVTFYYNNLTSGESKVVGRKSRKDYNEYISNIGRAAIYFAKGNVHIKSFSIIKNHYDYIFLGSSITDGYRVLNNDSSFVNQIRRYTNAVINNASAVGSSTPDYLTNSEEVSFKNKTVFLSGVFGNDDVFGYTKQQIKDNYDTLVQRVRRKNNRIVHIDNPYRGNALGAGGWAQLSALNLWLDSAYSGIDTIVHVPLLSNPTDFQDGDALHLNILGSTKIANAILAKLPDLFELHGHVDSLKRSSDSVFMKINNIWIYAYKDSSGAASGVTSVSGTTNRTTSTGGATPVIDISSAYVGQTSITTLGTIATGTLAAGAIIQGVTMTLGSDASFDMYYRSAGGVLTRLANGVTGDVLLATTSGAPSWGQAPATSGSYTPTLFNTTNVGASTAYECQYYQVGDVVTVSGEVDIDPTTTLTLTVLGISLPVSTSFANTYQMGGTASDDLNTTARIRADIANSRMEVRLTPTDVTNRRFSFTCIYHYTAP